MDPVKPSKNQSKYSPFVWSDVDTHTHTAAVISRLTTRNSRKWPKAFSYARKKHRARLEKKKCLSMQKKTRETSSRAVADEYGNWKSCSISVTKSQSSGQQHSRLHGKAIRSRLSEKFEFLHYYSLPTTAEHARGPASKASGTAQPTTAFYSIQFAT